MSRIVTLVAALLLALSTAVGQTGGEVEFREDHPREYVVQPGDTLWDIAAKFLVRPWEWPAVWQANPEIFDPHLIYPGDVISLVFLGDRPMLARRSPEIRREPADAINTIPLDAIEPFLNNARIVDEDTFENLPHVVANDEQRMMAASTDHVYVRGLDDASAGDLVAVAQVNHVYYDTTPKNGDRRTHRARIAKRAGDQFSSVDRAPGRIWGAFRRRDWPVIGYELWDAATARVIKTGDPAILELLDGELEVRPGDRVLPIDPYQHDPYFSPRAMDQVPEGAEVVALSQSYFGIGHYQIAALNIGADDGVEPGHTFSTFTPGEEIRDHYASPKFREERGNRVELPAVHSGRMMVFRTFDRVSYALVLEGGREVRRNDELRHPDEFL